MCINSRDISMCCPLISSPCDEEKENTLTTNHNNTLCASCGEEAKAVLSMLAARLHMSGSH